MKANLPRSGLLLALALLASCAPASYVKFYGKARAPLPAQASIRLPTLPRGAERLGRVVARCRPISTLAVAPERLLDVDCSPQRLERALQALAERRGGNLLAELDCHYGATLRCGAVVGRLPTAVAPVAGAGTPGDENPDGEIQVGYGPPSDAPEQRSLKLSAVAREITEVREFRWLPPSHVAVGLLEAQCSDCTTLELRDALSRVAARVASADLARVSCRALRRNHCSAELVLPEEAASAARLASRSARAPR